METAPNILAKTKAAFSTSTSNMAKEYKLKDIKSIDMQDGDKVEAEVEGIEGGKGLLVKMNGKDSGINPNCSHYGAPLKNGVLTPDGRLTCPWHGSKVYVLREKRVFGTDPYLFCSLLQYQDR